MKKLLILLFTIILFSCGSDSDYVGDYTQKAKDLKEKMITLCWWHKPLDAMSRKDMSPYVFKSDGTFHNYTLNDNNKDAKFKGKGNYWIREKDGILYIYIQNLGIMDYDSFIKIFQTTSECIE